jgi:hypothetical protein
MNELNLWVEHFQNDDEFKLMIAALLLFTWYVIRATRRLLYG